MPSKQSHGFLLWKEWLLKDSEVSPKNYLSHYTEPRHQKKKEESPIISYRVIDIKGRSAEYLQTCRTKMVGKIFLDPYTISLKMREHTNWWPQIETVLMMMMMNKDGEDGNDEWY